MARAAVKEEPGPGHNDGLTEKEERALLLNGLKEIETLTVEKDAVVGKIRTSRKRLVSHGFKPRIIDFALRLRKNEDEDEIEQRRAEIKVARFLGHPLGTEPDLFDNEDDTPDVDKAYAQGERAGAEGEKRSSPWSTGSAQEQAWLRGWSDGQAALMSGFKKLETPVEDEEEGDE